MECGTLFTYNFHDPVLADMVIVLFAMRLDLDGLELVVLHKDLDDLNGALAFNGVANPDGPTAHDLVVLYEDFAGLNTCYTD